MDSLRRLEEQAVTSVAFRAISTGAFGYPGKEEATVTMKSISETWRAFSTVELIRFVPIDRASLCVQLEAIRGQFTRE